MHGLAQVVAGRGQELGFGAIGALGVQRRLAQRRLHLFLLGDFGGRAEPLQHASLGVSMRHHARQEGAQAAIGAAQRHGHVERAPGRHAIGPALAELRLRLRIDDGGQAFARHQRGPRAGIIVPAFVEPGDLAVGTRDPGELGNGVGERTEIPFAFAQRVLGGAQPADVEIGHENALGLPVGADIGVPDALDGALLAVVADHPIFDASGRGAVETLLDGHAEPATVLRRHMVEQPVDAVGHRSAVRRGHRRIAQHMGEIVGDEDALVDDIEFGIGQAAGVGGVAQPALALPQRRLAFGQGDFGALALGDVGADGDILAGTAPVVEKGHDGRVHPILRAVLGGVADFAPPDAALGDGAPHRAEKVLGMRARIDEAMVLPEQFGARILRDRAELVVRIGDDAALVGDGDDGVLVERGNAGLEFEPRLGGLEIGEDAMQRFSDQGEDDAAEDEDQQRWTVERRVEPDREGVGGDARQHQRQQAREKAARERSEQDGGVKGDEGGGRRIDRDEASLDGRPRRRGEQADAERQGNGRAAPQACNAVQQRGVRGHPIESARVRTFRVPRRHNPMALLAARCTYPIRPTRAARKEKIVS